MAINSKRANEIDAYINENRESKNSPWPIEVNGRIVPYDTFELPIRMLQYNHDNGRFNLEIQEYESQIGRKLDPSDKEDVEKIKELLLQDKIEAVKLYDDLKSKGRQREPAAITHDGIVVNGNRRMATFELLHKDEPTGKWLNLWVVRLPKNISDSDLWKIEAGLQLSKERVAAYDPINNLLMIKEGKRAGLSNAEIAAAMYGWSEEQVENDLERLNIIDLFLQFIKAPGNYGFIKKFHLAEYFIDIQKRTLQTARRDGIPKREIQKRLEYNFVVLRASLQPFNKSKINFTHNDQRKVGDILSDYEATHALINGFDKEKDLRNIPSTIVMDNYSNAKDVLEYKKVRDEPKKLIDKAIAALNGIDRKGKHYKADDDVKKKLKVLDSLLKEMKTELGIK